MENNLYSDSDTISSRHSDINLISTVQDNLNTLTLNESPSEEHISEMPRKTGKPKIEKKMDSESKTDKERIGTETEKNPEKDCLVTKKIKIPIRRIPCLNIPEKVIICLDTFTDKDYIPFKTGDGSTFAPLYMLKRVIQIFLKNKSHLDPRHEFALLTLDCSDVSWIKDFTNNPTEIINTLINVTPCEPTEEEFKLSKILDYVWENVNIPKPANSLNVLPSFTVRLILLYNRSNCLPVPVENYEELLKNPYFTVDVIMTHNETPVEKYQKIFDNLQTLDIKGDSYKFEVGRKVTSLHDCMFKLLSHPLQRPTQKIAYYNVEECHVTY